MPMNGSDGACVSPIRNVLGELTKHSVEGDAACTKKRFGQVGPGIDANQASQTTNSPASLFNTGRLGGLKHCIGVLAGAPGNRYTKFETNPLLLTRGYSPLGRPPEVGRAAAPQSCSTTSGN